MDFYQILNVYSANLPDRDGPQTLRQ